MGSQRARGCWAKPKMRLSHDSWHVLIAAKPAARLGWVDRWGEGPADTATPWGGGLCDSFLSGTGLLSPQPGLPPSGYCF